jgi:hyperosmotically inducible periplasmic protein
VSLRFAKATGPKLLAVLAACALVGCAMTPRRSAAERAADAVIAGQVQAALLADPDIYARHIEVAVNRGVVNLGGFVWEPQDFATAKRDAASVPGVTSIVTDMDLMRGGIAGAGR